MKLLKNIICFALIVSFSIYNVKANKVNEIDEYLSIVNDTRQEIEIDEKINLDIKDYRVLYDVELKPNYLLINFSQGYAIVGISNQIISEYDITVEKSPYEGFRKTDIWIYGGPLNYMKADKLEVKGKSISQIKISDVLIKKNREFLSKTKDIKTRASASWTGIAESRFKRYAYGKWINSSKNYPASSGYSKNGICGTISSAILLAYLQDYVKSDYVPSSIRTKNSSSPGKLITTLFSYIDKGKNGTVNHDLCGGINRYLTKYSYQSNGHLMGYGLTTFSTAQKSINKGKPVCIGMLSTLGSTMGNHWVTAYQYIDQSGTSNDRYKCVGNQKEGQYAKVINVSWTAGIVYVYTY